jgi:hypothetical protein
MLFNRDKKLFGTAFVASLVWLAFQCALAQSYTVVDLGTPGNSGSYTNTAATGTLTCTDEAAANFQCRFYRAQLLP